MDKDKQQKALAAVRGTMQERVDDAVARYKGLLDNLHRETGEALRRFDTYKTSSTMRDQREGFVDSLYLNIGNMGTALAEAAGRVAEARRLRDEVVADLKARLDLEGGQ